MTTASRIELTPKRALFAREWLKDRNGTRAAIRAGYSETGASVEGARLLANASVRAEIDRLEASEELASSLTVAYIQSKIVHFIENAENESTAIRAVELGAKSLRMLVDVQESQVNVDVTMLASFTESQLEAMLASAAEPAALPVEVHPAD